MSTLPRHIEWRLKIYIVTVFQEQLSSMIYEGEKSSQSVVSLCRALHDHLDEQDVLTLDERVVSTWQDSKDVCLALIALMCPTMSSKDADVVAELARGRRKPQVPRPQDSVSVAVQTNAYWKKLYDAFVRAMPVIVEKEGGPFFWSLVFFGSWGATRRRSPI